MSSKPYQTSEIKPFTTIVNDFKPLQFPQNTLCWLKAVSICAEGLCIKADFLYMLDGRKGIQSVKSGWSIYCFRAKSTRPTPSWGK